MRATGRSRTQARLLAAGGLVIFLGGLGVAIGLGSDRGGPSTVASEPRTTTAAAQPGPPPGKRVRLTAVGALDPEGDGRENDELAVLAVDGDTATAWRTERYTSFFKTGVGLVLDAGRPVQMRRVTLRTDTPGFTAEIRGGTKREGPFRRLGAPHLIQDQTTIALRDQRARFLVIWVTRLPNGTAADASEVVLVGR